MHARVVHSVLTVFESYNMGFVRYFDYYIDYLYYNIRTYRAFLAN